MFAHAKHVIDLAADAEDGGEELMELFTCFSQKQTDKIAEDNGLTTLKNPLMSKPKGRPRSKRLKSAVETKTFRSSKRLKSADKKETSGSSKRVNKQRVSK
jgi:hypothetical protein